MGVTKLVLKLQVHKAKIKGVSKKLSVAMVTSCIGEKTLNCLMMIGNLYDTIIDTTNEKLCLN